MAVFGPTAVAVLMLDAATKAAAERSLTPPHLPHDVLGAYLRFTLVYNPGAAFGIHLGPASRVLFAVLTVAALLVLARLYAATRRGDTTRLVALALVCGGALGNLRDRLRSPLGVVDFVDVGVAGVRWPTFNVADVAITAGALLLAGVLWRSEPADVLSPRADLSRARHLPLAPAAADAGEQL